MTISAEDNVEQPFLAHLIELRNRLMRLVVVVLGIFLCLAPFANDLYGFIAQPMIDALPEGATMIATQVASPFLTPFKLAFVTAIFAGMPYILYQFWSFIAPGLYKHEKRLALPVMVSSILLFYLGMAFAFYVVFPLVFSFLTSVTPEGVQNAPDISYYLSFLLTLFFAFGFAFEVPIATFLLVAVGATTPDKLAHKRPYVIVGAFIIGMLLTPPDMISQTLLAVPMWFLFELGLIFSRLFLKKPNSIAPPENGGDDHPDPDPTPEPSPQTATATATAAAVDTPNADSDEAPFRPMSEEEMDAELDRIEKEEDQDDEEGDYEDDKESADAQPQQPATVDEAQLASDLDDGVMDDSASMASAPIDEASRKVEDKLHQVMHLRNAMQLKEARTLLYEVLVEGNDSQVRTAKNILAQLDELDN